MNINRNKNIYRNENQNRNENKTVLWTKSQLK